MNIMAYERRHGKILSGFQPLGMGVWTIELGSVKKSVLDGGEWNL
jgi:hypothetical protein